REARDAARHEGQQERGAHRDLAVAEELRELLGGELAEGGDALRGHALHVRGGTGVHAELADAGVEDEGAGDGTQDGGAEAHGEILPRPICFRFQLYKGCAVPSSPSRTWDGALSSREGSHAAALRRRFSRPEAERSGAGEDLAVQQAEPGVGFL